MNLVLATTLLKFLGSKMGIRLLLLLVVGLGALYTIHLLAGDFMRLQTTLTTAGTAIFGKRDVDAAELREELKLNITKQEIEFEKKIEWTKILARDPFSCALSLVCQLAAGAAKDNEEANRIYEFITHAIEHTKVPKKLKKSYDLGVEYNKGKKEDFKKCYTNYPICPYSADMMMRLIAQMNSLSQFLSG